MASILKKAAEFVFGVGLAEGAYRLHDQYKLLIQDQKGHLGEKVAETAQAFLSGKNRPDHHLRLVFSLPSKEETKRRQNLNVEKYIREYFGKSYLYETKISENEETPSVYQYDTKEKLFLYAGRAKELTSLQARKDILDKNYVSCKLEEEASTGHIIITGATSCDLCSLFHAHLKKETDNIVESHRSLDENEVFV